MRRSPNTLGCSAIQRPEATNSSSDQSNDVITKPCSPRRIVCEIHITNKRDDGIANKDSVITEEDKNKAKKRFTGDKLRKSENQTSSDTMLDNEKRSHLEKGDKTEFIKFFIMPASALDRLAHLQIDYPMLFKLTNPLASKVPHCGVIEFVADEELIYIPYWMMENMLLQEGDIVNVKNASLSKGTYVKL
ncbi:ubiquitin fusion degradation protein 1 [Tanacetum coccineum]